MNVVLRPATPLDAGTTGHILWQSLRDSPAPERFSEAEAIGYCGVMIDRNWVTVAVFGSLVRGFMARDGQEICALYTAPEARGRGIGGRLIDMAKRESARLYLQTPDANSGARRFYARVGFSPVSPPSDAATDEQQHARTYVWQKETDA